MQTLRRRRVASRPIAAAWLIVALVWACALQSTATAVAASHGPLFSVDVEPDTDERPGRHDLGPDGDPV